MVVTLMVGFEKLKQKYMHHICIGYWGIVKCLYINQWVSIAKYI